MRERDELLKELIACKKSFIEREKKELEQLAKIYKEKSERMEKEWRELVFLKLELGVIKGAPVKDFEAFGNLFQGIRASEKLARELAVETCIKGRKGDAVAMYCVAAFSLGWLAEMPTYHVLQVRFGNIGARNNIEKRLRREYWEESKVGNVTISPEASENALQDYAQAKETLKEMARRFVERKLEELAAAKEETEKFIRELEPKNKRHKSKEQSAD